MPDEPNIEIKSEEVQEILSTIPPWIIRWGIGLIFFVILLMITGSYFFSYPDNLSRITPEKLGFKILTPLPVKMKPGILIDYIVKPLLFPIRWTTLITEYDPPYKFVDQQLKGPYSFWHHTHIFEDSPEGTIIKDKVVYSLPWGIFGRLVHLLAVRKQLNKIFDFRTNAVRTYFEKPNSKGDKLRI